LKALAFQEHGGLDKLRYQDVADPTIGAGDVLVRVRAAALNHLDLFVREGLPGLTLPLPFWTGCDIAGEVAQAGAAVNEVKVGDRVAVNPNLSCGRCEYCRAGSYSQCSGGGGWIFGHLIDGLQAEYARVPFADTSVHKVPDGLSDEQVLFLADILPTAYEVGVLNGMVAPGDVVAIVGAGPIGLAALLTAQFYSPAAILMIDLDAIASPDLIVGSSTSGIPGSAFALGLSISPRVLIVHPVNPPYLVPVVELVPSPETSRATVEFADALMQAVGQTVVHVRKEIEIPLQR